MTIGLVFLSVLMATIVWWLLRQTMGVPPWQEQAAAPARAGTAGRPPAATGLWVFLGVASSLFALFLSAYAMRLTVTDWAPLPRPRLLLLNTALLAGASLSMAWTVRAVRCDQARGVRRALAASAALTLGFLAGQLVVWKQLGDAGYLAASSAAAAFFYLLTAVHGLHVLGGLVAWARAAARAWRGRDPARTRLGIELCATYWHYLLGVWLVLYALLVSSDLGLAICSSAPL